MAAQAGTDVKMASEVLRKLETRGLLERRIDTHDARAKTVTITQRGAELAKIAIEVVEQADADFLGSHAAPLVRVLRPLASVGSA